MNSHTALLIFSAVLGLTNTGCNGNSDSMGMEKVITFDKYDDHDVQMVVDNGEKIALIRVTFPSEAEKHSQSNGAQYFLKGEMMRLMRMTKPTRITSDISFEYLGGCPIYSTFAPDISDKPPTGEAYESIWFSKDAEIVGGKIRARGTPTREGNGFEFFWPAWSPCR